MFLERINLGLVILVGCALYEVYGVTKDVADHNFGYYLWDPGSIWVNMSNILPDLYNGNDRKKGCFILLCCLIREKDSIGR